MNQNLVENIVHTFEERYNEKPIIVFSPGRINIIGEHTGYNDGFVFPAAIDKGIVVAIQKSNANLFVKQLSKINRKSPSPIIVVQILYIYSKNAELRLAGRCSLLNNIRLQHLSLETVFTITKDIFFQNLN
jgi:hypothetical protein